jgi:drug/metabolite transporter (DMT)-like permease
MTGTGISQNGSLKAHMAIVGANVIYGMNFVIAKGLMPEYLMPRAIILLRITGSMLVFWLVSLMLPKEKVERRDLFKIAVCAFFGVSLNQTLFFEGLNLTTPINASIIITLTPVLVLIFANFFIHDKITLNRLIGILLGAGGAVIVILMGGSVAFHSGTLLGNILILINSVSYALYLVLIKPLQERYSALTIMKWVFFFGLIFVFPFSIQIFVKSNFTNIPFNAWAALAYVVFITTAFAYFLNNYSLRTVSASVNGIYIYLQPLVAAFIAIFFGKDHLTVYKVAAALMIFAGVYFVTRRSRQAFP